MNDSSIGGPLLPASAPAPLEDADLDALLQSLVVGITALAGSLVRPRWQSVVPKQPPVSTDWCAIGVVDSRDLGGPSFTQNADAASGLGEAVFSRHEDLEVLASFYGPNSMAYARDLRDGLSVPQNVEPLLAAGLAFIDADGMRSAPEFVNEQWVRRQDITLHIRRNVTRAYQVRNILGTAIQLIDDSGHIDDTISLIAAPLPAAAAYAKAAATCRGFA